MLLLDNTICVAVSRELIFSDSRREMRQHLTYPYGVTAT